VVTGIVNGGKRESDIVRLLDHLSDEALWK